MFTIYCHTHTSSGRHYVGLTKKTMMHRWFRHVYDTKHGRTKTHFARAILKYGEEAFSHEVLEVCHSLEVANLAEECWIELFDTRNPEKGFNLARGGSHVPHRVDNAYRSDPDFLAKVSENSKRLWKDPNFRHNVISATHAVVKSEPFRAAMSEKVKELWKDPSFREKNLSAAASSYTPERADESRRRWTDPGYRARCSSGAQKSNEERRNAPFCKRGHPRQVDASTPSGWARECHRCTNGRRLESRNSCPQGHPYDSSNTRLRSNGTRVCLLCEASKSASKPCAKCGGPKLRKSGTKFRCGPCTDARVSAWRVGL